MWKFFFGNEISLEDSMEHKDAANALTKGMPHCSFVDATGNIDISSEARKYGSSAEIQKNIIAQAILVNSLATRMVVNFFIRFNKPPKPTRLFTNYEDALDWLKYKRQEFEQLSPNSQA